MPQKIESDAQLIRRHLGGDASAFGQIADRHAPMVYRASLRLLGDGHEAEDAAQAVFVILARQATRFRKGGDLAAWLHGIARRVASEARRAKARRKRREEEGAMLMAASSGEGLSDRERTAALEALDREIGALPTKERQAVVLRYLEGHSLGKAAEIADCPEGTLGRRAHDGLARLRSRLGCSGAMLGTAALVSLLEAESASAVPATLVPSVVAASKSAVAAGAIAGGGAVGAKAILLAEGTMKAMMIFKLKVVAAVLGAVLVAGASVPAGKRLIAAGEGPVPVVTTSDKHIRCTVVRVLPGGKLVLSAGSTHGVKSDFEFDVTRGAQKIGAVKARDVAARKTTAEVISCSREIMIGDLAATRFAAVNPAANPVRAKTPSELPAFPGAVGFGATSKGGRGGKVIKVTNLNSKGSGSFAAACAAKGPRIVVFDVSGVIKGGAMVRDGRITIAGQTAPPPGIAMDGVLKIEGSKKGPRIEDVILRHMRVRFCGRDGEDSMLVSRGDRVMIDHVSVSWGADESLSPVHTKNITVQYATMEASRLCWEGGDEPHNFGMIISGGPATLNHIMFAHHHQRTPVPQYGIFIDYRNSVIYNCKNGLIAPPGGGNMVANYLKHGPGAEFGYPRIYHPVSTMACPNIDIGRKSGATFVQDNYLTHATGYYELATRAGCSKGGPGAGKPQPAPAVKTYVAEEAYERVMAMGGALPRDEITAKCIYEARTGTGLWDEELPRGDWRGRMKGGKPAQDSDSDGMPDTWETAHKLNPRDPGDANKTVPAGASPADRHKGYTYIEYYINERSDLLEAQALTASRLRKSNGEPAEKPEWKKLPKSIDELVADIAGQNYARVAKTEALYKQWRALRKKEGKSAKTRALGIQVEKQGGGETGTHLAWQAIWALRDAGPQAAPAAAKLAKIVDTTDNRQALFAAWALGIIAPHADEKVVVPALIKGLERTDYVKPVVNSKWNMNPRGFIAWALGRFGKRATAAIPALAKTMHGKDHWAKQPATWALRQMGEDAAPATDELVKALGIGWAGSAYEAGCGYHAAHALANIGKPAVPKIVAALSGGKNADQQRAAACALGLIGPDAAAGIPELIKVLRSKSPLVRCEAALALGKIDPKAAGVIPALQNASKDADYGVRNNVVKALGTCAPKNPAAVAVLEKVLGDKKKEVAYAAYRSLGNGGKAAIAALAKAAGNADAWHRKYATRALGDAARGKGGEKAVSALTKALSDKDAEVRREAVWSLALIGTAAKSAEGALKKAQTNDTDHVVRHAAGVALARVNGKVSQYETAPRVSVGRTTPGLPEQF